MNRLIRYGSPADHAKVGLWAGVIAGILFAMFEMIVSAAMGAGFFAPLRMIAGIVMGAQALSPAATALGTAIIVGLIVHLVLSAIYGAAFGAIATRLSHSTGSLAMWGSLFGFALWLVNFYIFAPLMFPWFVEANAWVQFIAHTFLFGLPLGLMVAWAAVERPASAPVNP